MSDPFRVAPSLCWLRFSRSVDSTPTHSYMKGLYKYPQTEYPYQKV